MAGVASEREKRLAELKKEVTRRGFDRHAYALSHLSELPAELSSPALTVLAERENIQTILLFPPQIQRGWHYVPKQALLFSATGLIHVIASIWPGEEPGITRLPRCDLMYMKVTLLLLYGFLEVAARGQELPIRLGMEFSTVDWYCLARPLKQFLQAGRSVHPAPTGRACDDLPLKFSNGLKIYGLLPGEALQELVFQPGLWKRRLYIFQQPILPDTLLLLTSHYMVVIQEDAKVRQGWIISYLPREAVTRIENQPCELWSEFSVQLQQGTQSLDYKLRLQSEAAEAWRSRWTRHGGQMSDLPKQPA